MPPTYKLDKRQKELGRKQKQERKKNEKLARKNQPAPSTESGEDPAVS